MALLIHLTPAKTVRRIRRAGIAANGVGRAGRRGVYCVPVLASYTLSHQWLRELKRGGQRTFYAVHFRVPDDEPVTVGHYGTVSPLAVTAAEAIGLIREQDDPRGYEIFVPRAIARGELHAVRGVSSVTGWRYKPDVHGIRPCACPACLPVGAYGAARIRARYDAERPRPGKPALMAALRSARSSDEIVDVLWGLSGRSRGGPEELAHLVDHPDPEVREVLATTLAWYRGQGARQLLARLRDDPAADVREAAADALADD